MGERESRRRGVVRDRWLRRLRRAGVAVPAVGAAAAAGLAATFAQHDATATAVRAAPSTHATPAPTSSATKEHDEDRAEHTTRSARQTSPTPAGTKAPVTHSGGS